MKPIKRSTLVLLALAAALAAIGGVLVLIRCRMPAPASVRHTTRDPAFVKMVGRIYSRGIPVGEVLEADLGLSRERVLALPADVDKASFLQWLEATDKRLLTISRLRVPRLRPERPSLDGRDIYDGFFAPAPGYLDFSAPLEGSISRLKKRGFTFQDQELQSLERMLRRCLGYQEQGEFKWFEFPVGSRIVMTSGKSPSVEVWINRGTQCASVDETIAKAQLEKALSCTITDPLEIQALNKHFHYSTIVDDDDVRKNTQGRYQRVCDRLYDIIREKKYDPADGL
ncbi:MAG: hypothetical protein ABSG86_15455 [Thermoguttaceae bacterium]